MERWREDEERSGGERDMQTDLAVLLVLVWVHCSESQNDYHANVITRDQLCTIPPYNGTDLVLEALIQLQSLI